MDYLYQEVNDAEFMEDTPLRRAFRKHLQLVVRALHDIEWVDSDDYGPGDDEEAIRACLAKGAEIEACIEGAERAILELNAAIRRAKDERTS